MLPLVRLAELSVQIAKGLHARDSLDWLSKYLHWDYLSHGGDQMVRRLHEPLLHFLLLGVGLFIACGHLNQRASRGEDPLPPLEGLAGQIVFAGLIGMVLLMKRPIMCWSGEYRLLGASRPSVAMPSAAVPRSGWLSEALHFCPAHLDLQTSFMSATSPLSWPGDDK